MGLLQRLRQWFAPSPGGGARRPASADTQVLSTQALSTQPALGGGRVVMLSEYVSISVLQTLRWGLAAALSVVLLIATLALLWIVSKVIGVRRLMGSA